LTKPRLDAWLVERGFFATRAKAQGAIMAGQVSVNGRAELKAGFAVAPDAKVAVAATTDYVSRGGFKLEAALEAFSIDARGKVWLDMGASTGGFTDCLLRRGARLVYAVDVGYGQIDAKLKADPRVVVFEKTHARDFKSFKLDPRPERAAVDVSFISLAQVLPWVLESLSRPCEIVALIKPQFEVGPKKAPKGVVRTAENRAEAIEKIRSCLGPLGLCEKGLIESPLRGAKGNVEYLIYLADKLL
jgi:23S rRNA (cytidine1920-2'-O)/16S rRNA (cytidine1409-2'-O)-methyltransferase